jgi:ribosomal protein L34E
MVAPHIRVKKYKFKKTATETKREYLEERPHKKRCAVTGKILSGVPRDGKGKISKHSKTQKRPSVPFGGILSGEAREKVFIEMGKVLSGKDINDVDTKYRNYVKQALKRADTE